MGGWRRSTKVAPIGHHGRGVYDLVECELVLVKGDRLHSYDAIHSHYTQLVLKYRAYMIYRTRYEYRTEYY